MPGHCSIVSILRHELVAQWRDGRARAVIAITLLLFAASAAMTGQQYTEQQAERRFANAEERQRWLNQPSRNPHRAAHYGVYVFKPVSPLGLLDPGLNAYLGSSTFLEAHWMNKLVHRTAQDTTVLARFPHLDPAQILQYLIPLMLILLGYGAFAGERSRGTLSQLLSIGVSPGRLAAGKLFGAAIWLLMVLLPALLLAVAFVTSLSDGSALFSRLGVWIILYLAYLSGWVLIVLAVSSRARTPGVALATLLGIWLMLCWILPRASAELVSTLQPLPSSAELSEQLQRTMGAVHSSEQAMRVRDRILAEYGVEKTEDLPIDWRGISLQEAEEANYPVFDRHFNAIFDAYRTQDNLLQYLSLAVPVLAIQMLSQAIAGSDLEHHRHFVFAAEQHRRLIQKLMNENVTLYDKEGSNYRADPELWGIVPPFEYEHPAVTDVLVEYRPAMFALLLWIAVTAAFAGIELRRMRP